MASPTFHSIHQRVLVAVIAVLLGLVATLSYVTWSDPYSSAHRLRDVRLVHEQVYAPTVALIKELQRERLLTVEVAADSSAERRRALTRQQEATDRAVDKFPSHVPDITGDAAELSRRVSSAGSRLSRVEGARSSRDEAAGEFTTVIRYALLVLDAMPDTPVGGRLAAPTALQHAKEHVAQQAATLAGVVAAGRDLTAGEYDDVRSLTGAADSWLATAEAQMRGSQSGQFDDVVSGEEVTTFRDMVGDVEAPGSDREPAAGEPEHPTAPVTADAWHHAAAAALDALDALDPVLTKPVIDASSAAYAAEWWMVTAWTIGLVLAWLVAIAVWVLVAPRHVEREAKRLTALIEQLTRKVRELPEMVAAGAQVDVTPPETYGPDEFGRLDKGTHGLFQAASEAMVQVQDQKASRAFGGATARRHQALIIKQQRTLSELMKDLADQPTLLKKVYTVDHAAARMRQGVANALIFAGDRLPQRRWSEPKPMQDVLRFAIQRVTDYQRVSIRVQSNVKVKVLTHAIDEVVHVLTEVVENAIRFSPPETKVTVDACLVSNGFAVEVEDRGLGLDEAELLQYNELVKNPPSAAEHGDPGQLGLFVVGQLASKREIGVTLRRSPYGGTSVVVLLPPSALTDAPPDLRIPVEDVHRGDSETRVASSADRTQ